MNEIIYSKKRETELVILGLGKIGSNLVKNFIHHTNFKIIIFDTKKTKIENSLKSNTEKHRLVAAYNIENIFDNTKSKKIIFVVVPSGKKSIDLHLTVKNLASHDDITLNCCNENFINSNYLAKEFKKSKKNYLSTGISGGTLGAKNGLAIMVGGEEHTYQDVLPILKKIAHFDNRKHSVNYFGKNGVGHLVKTFHNYLEYAEMQLLAEKIVFLRLCLGLTWHEIYEFLFKNTKTILNSYLLKITIDIIKNIHNDQQFYENLLPIVDHNNSGLWGLIKSIEAESFVPTLQISVMNRVWLKNINSISTYQNIHTNFFNSKKLSYYLRTLNQSYYFSRLSLMLQFIDLIADINKKNNINIDLGALQKNWSDGAIVSSDLVSKLVFIHKNKEKLGFEKSVLRLIHQSFSAFFELANQLGVPLITIYSSYTYLTYSSIRNTNSKIIALQRNKFGDHPLALKKNA